MLPRCDIAALSRFRMYISECKTKIEQHRFGPKCKNTIINSESKPLFCRVKGGDDHWGLYRLHVVTEGAEHQKGAGIARAWIEDPMVYPVHQCPNDGAGCRRFQPWLQSAVLLKLCGVWWLYLSCFADCYSGQLRHSGRDLQAFRKENHTKSKNSSYIYMKMQTYCNNSILNSTPPRGHNVDWTSVRILPLCARGCYGAMLQRCDVAQN